VLDREGLEQRACECYAVVRNEYARLLPAPQDSLIAGRILNLRVATQSQRMLHLSRNADNACSFK